MDISCKNVESQRQGENLKGTKRKGAPHSQDNPSKIFTDFSAEQCRLAGWHTRGTQNKTVNQKLYLAMLSFKTEGEIMAFPDKQTQNLLLLDLP